ncbi:DoxX family protein [Micromonospora sp. HUAS LYJ1]|uniref:DoxX family protein n=1 Tax=Micromonospora sp. HUAS LYJ1 TaxID=3061626 RepID=UPI0026739A00|nr:DoxX family protein [Micromonospora sp. HUAS LYJ1]WKU06533.1 DoxX family protein [Micromonospora sp. HUAS LYJ1]
MNVFLWIVQILLAAIFAGAGLTKLTQPKEKLLDRMGWVRNVPPLQVKALGAAELLAALGLVLPGLAGIATVLTPLAAVGLVIVMAGAIVVHVRAREHPGTVMTVVLLVLAAFVAWGRFGPYPL